MKNSKRIIEIAFLIICFISAYFLVFKKTSFIPENWYFFHASLLLLLGVTIIILLYRQIKYIKRYRIRSFTEIVDSILSSGWSKQLFVLAFFTVIAFLVSWALVYSVEDLRWEDSDLDKHQSFWLTVCYFFDPGNLNITNHNLMGYQWIISIVVAILGMTFLTGLFISTLTNIIEQRVSAVKNGLITYKGITCHSVVIGFCELTESVLRGILESSESGRKLILLTNHELDAVKKSLYSLTSKKEYDGQILLYSGDYRYDENLLRLNLGQAKSIYVLGDDEIASRDFENFACAQRISELIDDSKSLAKKKPTPMYVRMDRIPSFSTLQRIDIQSSSFSSSVYFRPFNYYEHWARILWVKSEVDFYDITGVKKHINYPALPFGLSGIKEDKFVHLVVSGFSQMGMALVLHALRSAHYSNYTEQHDLKTKITIIDPNLSRLKPWFLSQYQHLEQIYDVEIDYRQCMLEDIYNELISWSIDLRQMVTVAICLNDNDTALSQALNLPLEVYYQKGRESSELPRILVRQRSLSGIWNMLEEKKHEELTDKENDVKAYRKGQYNKYHNVYPFGMTVSRFYPDDMDDLKACLVHTDYEDKWMYPNKPDSEKISIERLFQLVMAKDDKKIKEYVNESLQRWYVQPENIKWANRYQTDNHHVLEHVLQTLGIHELADIHRSNTSTAICSDIEHRRWVGERVVSGWQQSPFIYEGKPMRQDTLLLHYDITKTSNIGNEAMKDDNVVKNVLMLDVIYNYIKENNLLDGED